MCAFVLSSRLVTPRLSLSRGTSKVVCRSSPGNAYLAATIAASLILASPALAEELNASQVYMQELQNSILERTGKEDALPELTEIPNETAMRQVEEEAMMQEVIAEQTAELVEPVKASTIAEQALKESVTAQTVTTGGASTETSKAALEVTAAVGGGDSLGLGAVAVVGLAAVAVAVSANGSGSSSATANETSTASGTAATPPAPSPAVDEGKTGSSSAPSSPPSP
jgi:hypothetical protein